MIIRFFLLFGFFAFLANSQIECFQGAGENISKVFCPSNTQCLSVQTLSGVYGYQCANESVCTNFQFLHHFNYVFREGSVSCCSTSLCNIPGILFFIVYFFCLFHSLYCNVIDKLN